MNSSSPQVSEAREAVARAIFRCGFEGDWDEATIEHCWNDASEDGRCRDEADAAIAALKSRGGYGGGCPETAAVKRASMDLTRSLAVMRRNPYNA